MDRFVLNLTAVSFSSCSARTFFSTCISSESGGSLVRAVCVTYVQHLVLKCGGENQPGYSSTYKQMAPVTILVVPRDTCRTFTRHVHKTRGLTLNFLRRELLSRKSSFQPDWWSWISVSEGRAFLSFSLSFPPWSSLYMASVSSFSFSACSVERDGELFNKGPLTRRIRPRAVAVFQ